MENLLVATSPTGPTHSTPCACSQGLAPKIWRRDSPRILSVVAPDEGHHSWVVPLLPAGEFVLGPAPACRPPGARTARRSPPPPSRGRGRRRGRGRG
jgi:hypothetical protein